MFRVQGSGWLLVNTRVQWFQSRQIQRQPKPVQRKSQSHKDRREDPAACRIASLG